MSATEIPVPQAESLSQPDTSVSPEIEPTQEATPTPPHLPLPMTPAKTQPEPPTTEPTKMAAIAKEEMSLPPPPPPASPKIAADLPPLPPASNPLPSQSLLAKARAYRQSQEHNPQLESSAQELAAQLAQTKGVSLPEGDDLDVPTFLRQQRSLS